MCAENTKQNGVLYATVNCNFKSRCESNIENSSDVSVGATNVYMHAENAKRGNVQYTKVNCKCKRWNNSGISATSYEIQMNPLVAQGLRNANVT